jgi:hypothetical protein
MAYGTGHKVPNETGNALASVKQAETDEKDWEIMREGFNASGVISGCAVTAQGSPNMTVAVSSGVIVYQGTVVTVASDASVTILSAEGTPRFDLIMVDTATGNIVDPVAFDGKGTASADPVFPLPPANRVVIAAVYVGAGDTDIDADQIVDKRVFHRGMNLQGTYANRPAAGFLGRTYYATDIHVYFYDSGTTWLLQGSNNVFDTFNRSNGNLGTADSGHLWTTDGLQITSNEVRFSSGSGQGRINLGHPITRATFKASIVAGTGSVLDAAIILKWLDATHYLYVQLLEANSLRIVRVNGTHNLVTSVANTILDNNVYGLWVELDGSFIDVKVYNGLDLTGHIIFGDKTDFLDPFTSATTVGMRLLAPSNAAIRDFVVNCDR